MATAAATFSVSSRRKPGPITPGLNWGEGQLLPSKIERFRGMGPGFRRDDETCELAQW